MNIIFMGTPSYATEILKELLVHKEINLLALFTQPDKPVGRKKTLTPPHTKQHIIDNNINLPIYQPTTLKSNEVYETIDTLNPDIIVVAAYGQIIPKNILKRAFCINLHASILPQYRGASPIQDTILNRDNYTGVTAMAMDEGLDTGDILGISYVKINKDTRVDELFERLSYTASKLTIKTLFKLDIQKYAQNSAITSKCSKITKKDGLVSFDSALILDAKFRAYHNWPSIYLDSGLKILSIKINEIRSINKQGVILSIDKNSITIGCEIGSIIIDKIQPKSKKPMGIIDYIRGKRIEVGDILS